MISLVRAAWQEELRTPKFVGLSTDGFPSKEDPAMKNGARCYHMDTAKEYEYSNSDDQWYEVPSGGGGGGGSEGITVIADSNTVINGYQVPALSTIQIQAVYNAVISGKSVSIIDATEMMTFQGINADVISDEIFISFRYFDKMFLEYAEDGTITYTEISGGGLPPVTGSGKALVSVDGEWVEQSGYPYEESATGETIEWDGDTTGKIEVEAPFGGIKFYKISSSDVPDSMIIGSRLILGDTELEIDANLFEEFCTVGDDFSAIGDIIYFVHSAGATIADMTFPEPGVYFEKFNDENYVSLYEYGTPSTIHTIDPKYLPSDIPTTDDVQNMIDTAIGDAIGGSY